MVLTEKIRLHPTVAQTRYLRQAFGISRHTYNWALAHCRSQYESGVKGVSGFAIVKAHNAIKYEEFPWVAAVSKWVTQTACHDLADAYTNFFSKRGKFPKFKKKHDNRHSFGVGALDIEVEDRRLKIPKLSGIRMARRIRFPGKIVGIVRIIVDACGDYWAAIPVELDSSFQYRHRCESQAAMGIDLGLKSTCVLSDGNVVALTKQYRRSEKKLARLQQRLCRKKKESRNRAKARVVVAKLHRQTARRRANDLHQVTSMLARSYRTIGIEDLSVAGMVRALRLGKAVSDAGFGEFRRQLQYKAALAGSTVIVADRWFPSSKTCSACGCVHEKLELGERTWTCSHCKSTHDRDVNAAVNLRNVAVRYTETENVCGGVVSVVPRICSTRESPWKQKSGKTTHDMAGAEYLVISQQPEGRSKHVEPR